MAMSGRYEGPTKHPHVYGAWHLFCARLTGDMKLLQLLTAKPWLKLQYMMISPARSPLFDVCVVTELEAVIWA